jgi:membrane-associated phospholipid phosphatase
MSSTDQSLTVSSGVAAAPVPVPVPATGPGPNQVILEVHPEPSPQRTQRARSQANSLSVVSHAVPLTISDSQSASHTAAAAPQSVADDRHAMEQQLSQSHPTASDSACGPHLQFSQILIQLYHRISLVDWLLAILMWVASRVSKSFPNNEQTIPGVSMGTFDRYDLKYPYHDSTISGPLLFVLSVILPGIVLGVCAYVTYHRKKNILTALVQLNNTWLGLISASALNVLLTDILKKVVGAPRPNFFYYCEWDVDAMRCMSHNEDARSSFPSGHSSTAFVGLTFLSMFLMRFTSPYFYAQQAQMETAIGRERRAHNTRFGTATLRHERLDSNNSVDESDEDVPIQYDEPTRPELCKDELQQPHRNEALRVILCLLPVCLACYIASTRITDYWHHYVDVLAGSILGLLVAKFQFSLRFPRTLWIN